MHRSFQETVTITSKGRCCAGSLKPPLLHGAEIELSLTRFVFRDVGQPQLIWPRRGEDSLHPIVMHGWAWFPVAALLLREHAPQPLLGTEPPDTPFAGGETQFGEFVGDEPIPERRVISMRIERGVNKMSVVPVPGGDGVLDPFIERLRREAQHPAGHRDGNPYWGIQRGKVTDQREHHFGSCA